MHDIVSTHVQIHEHSLTHCQHQIFNNCQEHPLPNCYTDTTVFNDLAIHTFPQAKLLSLPLDTWTDPPEPIVDTLDPEIITSQPL